MFCLRDCFTRNAVDPRCILGTVVELFFVEEKCFWFFSSKKNFLYRPYTDPVQTRYRPYTNFIPASTGLYRLYTDPIPTLYQSYTGLYRPYTDPIPPRYRSYTKPIPTYTDPTPTGHRPYADSIPPPHRPYTVLIPSLYGPYPCLGFKRGCWRARTRVLMAMVALAMTPIEMAMTMNIK